MQEAKKTLVLGASVKSDRFSNIALKKLREHHFPVVAIGSAEGKVADVEIETGKPKFEKIHTVTLYVNPARQKDYYDYILSLKPKRIVFNPGTHNDELITLAEENHIEAVVDCTLVMLDAGEF